MECDNDLKFFSDTLQAHDTRTFPNDSVEKMLIKWQKNLRTMWIPTVPTVIVYFCACAIAAEIRTKYEQNHGKSVVKRSVDPYNKYHKYNSNNYNSYNNKYGSYNSLNNLKLRHQSRFPNLDKVMNRVNNMKYGSESKSEVHNKLRHRSWYEKRTTTTTTPPPEEDFENYFDDYGSDKENNDDWVSNSGA